PQPSPLSLHDALPISRRSSTTASRHSSPPTPTAEENRDPGRRGGLYDFVRRILQTDWGKELYLRRQGSVESVFGQIKANRGVRRFQRSGRLAVLDEWRLMTATHNHKNIHKHSVATG